MQFSQIYDKKGAQLPKCGIEVTHVWIESQDSLSFGVVRTAHVAIELGTGMISEVCSIQVTLW